jgi:hypothetical protein
MGGNAAASHRVHDHPFKCDWKRSESLPKEAEMTWLHSCHPGFWATAHSMLRVSTACCCSQCSAFTLGRSTFSTRLRDRGDRATQGRKLWHAACMLACCFSETTEWMMKSRICIQQHAYPFFVRIRCRLQRPCPPLAYSSPGSIDNRQGAHRFGHILSIEVCVHAYALSIITRALRGRFGRASIASAIASAAGRTAAAH